MDLSKLNQKELPFQILNGQGSINTYTGRILFNLLDITFNIGSYNLSVNHIYNSHFELPLGLTSNYGNKWKLDIEQYIYQEGNKYIYIDSNGMKHEFVYLHNNQYYDTSGLNYIYDNVLNKIYINDETTLLFNNNRLVEIEYKEYSIMIVYENNKIIKLYNTRNENESINFIYNEKGLLSKLNSTTSFDKIYELNYYYDSLNQLRDIKKKSFKVLDNNEIDIKEKKLYQLTYKDLLLTKLISFKDNKKYEISYLDFKAKSIDEFNIKEEKNISSVIGNDSYFHVGEDRYLGEEYKLDNGKDNLRLGEIYDTNITETIRELSQIGGYYLDYNLTEYKTDITDHKGNIVSHFYTNDGNYCTKFEKVEQDKCRNNNLIGVSFLTEGNFMPMINNLKSYWINSPYYEFPKNYDGSYIHTTLVNGNNISLNNISPKFFEYRDALALTSNILCYNLVFYLNMDEQLLSDKIAITIAYNNYSLFETFYGYCNKEYKNVWQTVSIPINFKAGKIRDISDIIITLPYSILSTGYGLSNMKFMPSSYSELMLYHKQDSEKNIKFNEITHLVYEEVINNETLEVRKEIFKDIRLDLNDLLLMKKEILKNIYIKKYLSYNNTKYKRLVEDIYLEKDNEKIYLNDYDIGIYQLDSTKEKITNIKYNFLNENNNNYMDINYHGFMFSEDGQLCNSYASKRYNMNNILIKEETPRGLMKIYSYDKYNDLYEVNYYKQNEGSYSFDYNIKYTINPSSQIIETNENIYECIYDNDCVVKQEKIYEIINNEEQSQITTYVYDDFNELLLQVLRNDGSGNYIMYSDTGKVIKMNSCKHSNMNLYNNIYGFTYNSNYNYNGKNYDVSSVVSSSFIKDSNNKFIKNKYDIIKTAYNELDNTVYITHDYTLENENICELYEYDGKNRIKTIKEKIDGQFKTKIDFKYNIDDYSNNESNSNIDYNTVIDYDNEMAIKTSYNNNKDTKKIYSRIEKEVVEEEESEEESYFDHVLTISKTNDKINYEEYDLEYYDLNNRFTEDLENEDICLITSKTNIMESSVEYDNNVLSPQISKLKIKLFEEDKTIDTDYLYNNNGQVIKKEIIDNDNINNGKLIKNYNFNNNGLLSNIDISAPNSSLRMVSNLLYDYLGNINSNTIYFDNSYNNQTYIYDKNNQLIQENNSFGSKTYNYYEDGSIDQITETDLNNNIISKKYNYNDGLLTSIKLNDNTAWASLEYSNRKCKKLIIDGKELNFGWKGSKLVSCNNYEYKYSAIDGTRIYKINKSTQDVYTKYQYDGSRLIKEDRENEAIIYLYDNQEMIGFAIKDTNGLQKYYYIKNFDNTVLGIVNESYELIGKYIYDAYGNCEIVANNNNYTVNNTILEKNPIRYKGYYYDNETNLFLASSRYYSPELCRWISPDDIEYLDPESVNGLNLYCYCLNNPIMYVDPDGHSPKWWQWALSGAALVGGAILCFIPGGQGLGVSLLVAGGSMMASNIMDAAGVDGKTASLISSGLNIVGGIALCFTPFAGIGANMIGSGIGGIAGGYISEALGGSFELGAAIGNIVGGIAGGKVYDYAKFSRIAKQGILIGKMGQFEAAAASRNLAYYNGMPGYNTVAKISPGIASKLGWANNHHYISNVMKHGGMIYNLGGPATGSYGKELALIANYLWVINL